MIVYISIILIFIYAVYKERQALGCRFIPNGTDCDNANGKVVHGTKSYPNDTQEVLKTNMKNAIYANERFVVWRLSYIIAFFSSIIIWFLCFRHIPKESELLISLLVIGTLLYFSFGFYQFHMWGYVQKNANETLEFILRHQEQRRQHQFFNIGN